MRVLDQSASHVAFANLNEINKKTAKVQFFYNQGVTTFGSVNKGQHHLPKLQILTFIFLFRCMLLGCQVN